MDFSKLYEIIEEHRSLSELSSLPFIIDTNGLKIRWFNYTCDQNDTLLYIHIKSIFTIDEKNMFSEQKKDLVLRSILKEYPEPILDEKEYLNLLSKVFTNYNKEQMASLLSIAETRQLLDIYQIISYLF